MSATLAWRWAGRHRCNCSILPPPSTLRDRCSSSSGRTRSRPRRFKRDCARRHQNLLPLARKTPSFSAARRLETTSTPAARTTTPPPPPIDAPAGEPGDKPTDPADTQRYIDRAKEAAQEGSLRGVDSGVEKLIQNLIVGSPAAIAAATKVLAGWMIAGTHGAAAGVAWAVIRIVIGSFKNRRPLPVG